MRRSPPILLATLLSSACSSATTQDHMLEHFQRAGELQDALVRGEWETTRDVARWMENHETSPGLPAWSDPFLTDFRQTARRVSEATDPAETAVAAGRLLRACGACHESAPGGPYFTVADAPPEGEATGTHMIRHAWSVHRMSAGLIGPSPASWEQGLAALQEAPLDPTDLGMPPEHVAEAGEIGVRLHGMAREARDLRFWDERAEAFGRITYQCASCHTQRNGR